MIRFMPDTWVDVVMRPLDMISPEANIYVEVPAPDLRLAAALLLVMVVLLTAARKRQDRGPALQLLALTLLAMVPWLVTSGNGRYFTPFLLLLGPLCVGLVRLLPVSRFLKFSAAGSLLLLQGFLLFEASPVGQWSLVTWRDGPYFQIAKPPAEPRSYVTLSPISYSLIAPLFPEQSRWMNASAPVAGQREREYTRRWLEQARSLYLVAPSLPSQMDDHGQPSQAVIQVFNRLVAGRGLSVAADAHCEFLASGGLANFAMREGTAKDPRTASRFGFWLCPARYDPHTASEAVADERDPAVEAVFDAVEKQCPRFFPPGEAVTQRLSDGSSRHYGNADTRVYVMDDGEVLYKFWRSINAVTIGSRADLLAGRAHLDCSKIRAPTWRTGGP
jgi:hypothetical protein